MGAYHLSIYCLLFPLSYLVRLLRNDYDVSKIIMVTMHMDVSHRMNNYPRGCFVVNKRDCRCLRYFAEVATFD